MFQKQITNRYLDDTKIVKAKTERELEEKVKGQKEKWKEKEDLLRMKETAKVQTDLALDLIHQYRSLLTISLTSSQEMKWDELYDKTEFNIDEPILELFIKQASVPEENKFIEFIFPFIKKKREEKQEEAKRLYQQAYTEYINESNQYFNEQKEKNKKVDVFRASFEKGVKSAIEQYFKTILSKAPYPKGFIKNFDLGYEEDTKTLIVEYIIPSIENIPDIIEHKFVQTRKTININRMKKEEFIEFHYDIIYQITLKTIYECFITDYPKHIESIAFNGNVQGIDTATGNEFISRIISILVNKDDFMTLNLNRVVPKDCFRKLKGVSSASLQTLAPVKPFLELNKIDNRFIEMRDVLSDIDSIPNIAEMKWDDFEHLVTNLFELYFKDKYGEVRITKKSREGGIDGVIFDHDIIRGGKYLIQAKKYNKIVSPSAVRELGGAMSHEKATRGILITTSYFGPESQAFANENNITLIDGENLVQMLSEYGYQVRCEIKKKKGN